MKISIEVEVPHIIVEHLKNKEYSEMDIRMIFREYLDFYIEGHDYDPLESFNNWADENVDNYDS